MDLQRSTNTILRTWQILAHLILITTLWSTYSYDRYFTNEETEAENSLTASK